MAEDIEVIFERVRALLEATDKGACLLRDEVESTLTDGYARALELDAECLRLDDRIERMTQEVARGRQVPAGQLSGLLRRLQDTEQQCVDLRAALAPLRKVVARAA